MELDKDFEVLEPQENHNEQDGKPKTSKIAEIFDWIDTVVVALIAVVIIFSLFFRIATIVGPSMQNTLYSGERVIISNFFYKPQYGDIVVISRNTNNSVDKLDSSREPIIKRVIATEGQYVDINFETGKVYVGADLSNMTELDEAYVNGPTTLKYDIEFPVFVKEGHIFVLGDNRNNSTDSRSSSIGDLGLIDERYVLGKAIYRIWPFDTLGGLYNNE
ncbi:MAG: signal peptidase I [Clostridia bacterium]|nr:signal peptidase I [Clostridia bacterium]